jgi:hypothetical protein
MQEFSQQVRIVILGNTQFASRPVEFPKNKRPRAKEEPKSLLTFVSAPAT